MNDSSQILNLVVDGLLAHPCLQSLAHSAEVRRTLEVATRVSETAGRHSVSIQLGFPCSSQFESIRSRIEHILGSNGLDSHVELEFCAPDSGEQGSAERVPGVKQIIAVASGKGGVGKSTTSANVALALAYEGAKVGLLDADIYGPSQPQMFGLGSKRPDTKNGNTIIPLQAYGVKVVSMGSLVTEKTPMIWRGPMVSGAMQQLLRSTDWQDIDYLVIDMPPGTGDIQLTLSQTVPVSGAVIVTTPQDIALLDAVKGIEMFHQVSIPVLGVVENMAVHVCSNCGYREAIFGSDGGETLASDYGVDLLGQLPLQLAIREQTDGGKPPVVHDPASQISSEYRNIARNLGLKVWMQSLEAPAAPSISIDND